MQCPQCGKEIKETNQACKPFCSDRCKLIDLGKWISGEYRIAAVETDEGNGDDLEAPPDPEEE